MQFMTEEKSPIKYSSAVRNSQYRRSGNTKAEIAKITLELIEEAD